MNERVLILRDAVVKITQMLSGKGVKVTQRGISAYVNADSEGRPVHVNLPYLPDNATDELCLAIQGFLDHEVAHILFSDFKLAEVAEKAGCHSMTNILEDARIEREMAKRFTGCASNLATTGKFFLDQYVVPNMQEAAAAGDANKVIGLLMPPLIRAMSGQLVFKEFMKDKMHIVQPVYDEIADLEERIANASSTAECFELAKEIEGRLRKKNPAGNGPKSKGQPDPSGMADDEPKSLNGKAKDETEEEPKKQDKGEKSADSGKDETRERKDGAGRDEEDRDEDPSGSGGDESDDDAGNEEGEGEGSDKGEEQEKEGDSKGSKPSSEESDENEDDAGGAGEGEDDEEDEDGAEAGEGDDEEGGGDEEPEDDEDDEGEGEGEGAEESGGSNPVKPNAHGDADDAVPEEMEDGATSPLWEAIDKENANGYDKNLSAMISHSACSAARHAEYLIYTKDADRVEPLRVGSGYDSRMLVDLCDKVDHMVGPLQKDLERAIAARSLATWEAGRRSGRLHAANLSRLAVGDSRVFRKRHETTSKDVAVELVIDASGSMAGSKVHLATQSAYALSSVLERIGISHEVVCFTTGDPCADERTLMEEQRKIGRSFTRVESLYMPIIKTFNERLRTEVKERFAWLPNSRILRNNIDGECVEIALRRLLSRRESGKVMIVLSDGMPNAFGDTLALRSHLKKVVRDAAKRGVNVVGIGINTDAVQNFYPKNLVIRDVNELPDRVIKELRHLLIS